MAPRAFSYSSAATRTRRSPSPSWGTTSSTRSGGPSRAPASGSRRTTRPISRRTARRSRGEPGSTLTQDLAVDLRYYLKITRRSLFAFRAYGARSTGNFPNVYYFGGLDTLRGLDFREQIGNTVGYANVEFRFPLIDLLAFPFGAFQNVRAKVFFDVGGAKLENQDYQFWDSDERQLIDGRAAYGYGIQFSLFGLQLHWDFSKLTDLKSTTSGLKTSFYIGAEF